MTEGLPTSNSLVRAIDSTRAIEYYEYDGKGYFLLDSIGGIVSRMKLESSYHVKDFRILDGSLVCFCGYVGNEVAGFFGYFNCSAMVSGNEVTCWITQVPQVNHMNKMVAYNTSYSTRMVAVADSSYIISPYLYHKSMIVSYDITFSEYRITPSSTVYTEHYDDIVETRSSVIIVGGSTACEGDNIALWRYPKYTLNISDMNTTFCYPMNDAEPASKLHACALDSNRLAVSYLYNGINNDTAKTRIRYFDTIDNLNNIEMYRSQEYRLPIKGETYDMIYFPDSDMVVLLQGYGSDTNNAFYFLQPYNASSYLTYRLANLTYSWESIGYAKRGHFVASAGSTLFLKHNPAPHNSSCYYYDSLSVVPIRKYPAVKRDFINRTLTSFQGNPLTFQEEKTFPSASNNCVHY